MGGGDFFNLYEYFFACVDNFLKYDLLHEFVFYFNL
jgi:hypothetical protein